jgi:hypothetical protein
MKSNLLFLAIILSLTLFFLSSFTIAIPVIEDPSTGPINDVQSKVLKSPVEEDDDTEKLGSSDVEAQSRYYFESKSYGKSFV